MFLVQDLKGLGYEKGKPVGLVGVTELSDAQKKQLKEQQEVRPGGQGRQAPQGWWSVVSRSARWCSGHSVFFVSLCVVPGGPHTQGRGSWLGRSPVSGMPSPKGPPQPTVVSRARPPHAA